jgi:hypothetical protein
VRNNITTSSSQDPSQGQITLTLDFPPAWPITQMSRSAGVTTARICLPAPVIKNFPGLIRDPYNGKWIHVDPGNRARTFGALDVKVLLNPPKEAYGPDYIDVTYPDPGMDVPTLPVTGAGMSGHMLLPGDIIEVNSTDAQWPQIFYRVISILNHN